MVGGAWRRASVPTTGDGNRADSFELGTPARRSGNNRRALAAPRPRRSASPGARRRVRASSSAIARPARFRPCRCGGRCARRRRDSDCACRSPSTRTRPSGSVRSIASTALVDSTKLRQSTDESRRRLPIELPSVTWSAAWPGCRPAPVARSSCRPRPAAARPSSARATAPGSGPAGRGRTRTRTARSSAGPNAPCPRSRGSGSSGPRRRRGSSGAPSPPPGRGRCVRPRCATRRGAGSRSARAAA